MAGDTLTENPTMGTPHPSVPLPPAALRLEHLDFDPTGNPYYKFPPFVSPPDGVKLIPFKKFKPHGVQITLDSDEEELDGEGIPTVELGAKHNITDEKEKKKKKKKANKEGDEPKKNSPWWDEWAEGEDLRRGDVFDPNIPRTDRFTQGALDFAPNRKWSPQLQSLYDCFRHYVGLLSHPTKSARRYGKADNGEEADNEDEDDDEAELKAEEANQEQAAQLNPYPEPLIDVDTEEDQPKIHEVDEDVQRKYEEEQETKELRMDAFLNDSEQGIKIFFSSHYKDKGHFWSASKLRDGPILLTFFLSFFIRNRIMPDYEREFRKAYKVAEQARIELPHTTKISMAIPDMFGQACTALWGSKQPQAWVGMNKMDVDEEGSSRPAVPEPEPISEPVKEWEAQLKESGVEKIEVDMATEPEVSGWGASHAMEGVQADVGGWGDGATIMQDGSNPWAAPPATDDWGAGNDTPVLFSFLGPTTIPLTHAVQLAEKSTRQIVSFAPPNPEAKGLESVLGTLVLAPWKTCQEGSTILRPELLTDVPEGSTFDPSRDTITAFIDPKAVEVLKDGMGLSAIFVKVAENTKEVKDKKKSKSRSKGKGKGKGNDDSEWWYIEFLYEVLPSFWTEESG